MGRKGEELGKYLKGKRKRLLTYNCSFEFCSGRFTLLGCVSLLLRAWNEPKKEGPTAGIQMPPN